MLRCIFVITFLFFTQISLAGDLSLLSIFTKHGINTDELGVQITRIDTGEVLFSHRSDVPMPPASTLKLIVAAAALDQFTPGFKFKTDILSNDQDLCIRGHGDPSSSEKSMGELVQTLENKFLLRDKQTIYLDEALLPQQKPYSLLFQKDFDEDFAADNAAFHFNYNAIELAISPSKTIGHLASVYFSPHLPNIDIHNTIQTVSQSHQTHVQTSIQFQNNRMQIYLSGKINQSRRYLQIKRAVPHNTLYYGLALNAALHRPNVSITSSACPKDMYHAWYLESPPLIDLLKEMNKNSNNLIAEVLFRQLTPYKTCEASRRFLCDWLDREKANQQSVMIENGSGLSRESLISAQDLSSVLQSAISDFWYGKYFIETLSIAGVDGTLKNTFKNKLPSQQIYGKSGTLDHVSTLAGYATESGKPTLSFVFFLKNQKATLTQIRRAQEEALQTALRSL